MSQMLAFQSRRLVFKLLISVLVIEISLMPALGIVYYSRFSAQIDARHAERLQTATDLIARNRLNLTSLADRETMSLLLGSDLADAMIITDLREVAFSLNPAYRKQSIDAIPFLAGMRFDGQNQHTVLTRIKFAGQPYLVSVAALTGPVDIRVSSFLYLRVSEAGSQAEKKSVSLLLILGLAITALATSAALMVVSDRSILRPIALLAQAVKRVQAGDLSARISIDSETPSKPDEIQILKSGFDAMVQQLQALVDGLEHRVLERTRDLALAKDAAEAAQRRAEAAGLAKTTFLSTMSHELRSPLNGILGFAQILQLDKSLSERALKGLNIIRQSGDHLLTLINDILDMAKGDAGHIDFFPKPVRLGEFLRVVADIVSVRAEQKSLVFTVDLDIDIPERSVLLDPKRMRQVLLNLLSNAVKFTDEGEVTLRVKGVVHEERMAALHFEVVDTGVGMSEEQQRRLFRAFEQLGDAKSRKGGTGLGLVIAGQLVEAMGSTIHVESTPGKGTRFWFDLLRPLATSPTGTVILDQRPVVGYAGPRRRILVVDDLSANRALLEDLFNSLGFKVNVAVNGEQGLAAALSHVPDLIIMDVAMPVMDGFEATKRLRADHRLSEIRVLAITASPSTAERQRMLEAGADSFLQKPIESCQLLTEVQRLLNVQWRFDQS